MTDDIMAAVDAALAAIGQISVGKWDLTALLHSLRDEVRRLTHYNEALKGEREELRDVYKRELKQAFDDLKEVMGQIGGMTLGEVQENQKKAARLNGLEEENKRLWDVLRLCEWRGWIYEGGEIYDACPICGQVEGDRGPGTHKPDCKLGELLTGKEV